MATPRHIPADHLHITEFASRTYFDKLNQENKSNTTHETQTSQPGPSIAQSEFILPLRQQKAFDASEAAHPEAPKKKKAFRFWSSKHAASSIVGSDPSLSQVSADGSRTSLPFDQLFIALPVELQVEIVASLPLSDILNLRSASRAWHSMITLNEVPIARYHLENNTPAYAKRLYPLPDGAKPNLHHLCGIWHRLHVAAKLAYFICERVTKEIFLRVTEIERREFAPSWERMRRRLIPLIFTIFHFFETYRERHLQYLIDNKGVGLRHTPYTLNPIEVEVMNMYDDRTLLHVHQVFPLVVSSFCRRLRPPSYAGRVERTVRGYLREKPADEVHVAALIVGGLRQVEKFWEVKGYNTRRTVVDNWYKSVSQPTAPEPTISSKTKRSLMGLGRKKSMAAIPKDNKPSEGSSAATRGSIDSGYGNVNNPIFTTSLAEGMPMATLPWEHLQMLVPDLPPLQQMWLHTAEALILDRKIVQRPAEIKRNAQMMLELISEGGMAEEDQWWYGQGGSDSIRPPLESIEDDPLE
ncbi:uncharacterized protein PpBr36_05934 [Pyricularia pennisetigena]|uniref:uncharacterized protein n=1 Tax=Pyricularia pennisetigena TaxID=1578925 RepID=UPI00114DB7C0|nr:uncharacterized protein PpBr36_05934 [Pyricularia pennisetigena]TLS23282.1 hypothetical protein PpBr36_05934 [Pyricularia pennisetigena]